MVSYQEQGLHAKRRQQLDCAECKIRLELIREEVLGDRIRCPCSVRDAEFNVAIRKATEHFSGNLVNELSRSFERKFARSKYVRHVRGKHIDRATPNFVFS